MHIGSGRSGNGNGGREDARNSREDARNGREDARNGREDARTANLLGALALEAAGAQEAAVTPAVGQSGAAAAALITIAAHPGRTIERLRAPLGLSQPGAVRLVERLTDAGWVERGGPGGRRGFELRLTPPGEEMLEEVLAARRAALATLLEPLTASERGQLTALLEKLLAARTGGRDDLERLCRLCEWRICRRCPVAGAARAARDAQV